MRLLSPVEPLVGVEIRATIKRGARSAALLAGAVHCASPFTPSLRGELVSQAQQTMLENLERQFGRRLASRAFWDLRRATRLAGTAAHHGGHHRPPGKAPTDQRVLATVLDLSRRMQLLTRALFPHPEAVVVALAAYRQTWRLGLAWAECPIAPTFGTPADD